MVELTDCYFCGTVEDPLDAYSVIPPEHAPPEEAQRTVVVCPTCRTKLARVVDPVVEFYESAGTDVSASSGDEAGQSPEEGSPNTGGAPPVAPDSGKTPQGLPDSGDSSPDPSDATRAAVTSADVETGDELPDEGDEPPEGGGEPHEGIDAGEGEQDGAAELPEPPDETGDIVRLLRNREFPVDREQFVTVAANAYQIRRPRCEQALDALVARNQLRERDGMLYRAE